MKRGQFKAEAEIKVVLQSRQQLNAIEAALTPEAGHPAGGKANATITRKGNRLKIAFKARDSPSLRAIMNSYLRMLKATTAVCTSLLDLERKHGRKEAESQK